MAEKLYKVAGFTFTDENGAREALKEQKTIEYIESKTNMNDPKMIQKVYRQIVDQNMFHTPVGFSYINKLKYLLEEVNEEENKIKSSSKQVKTGGLNSNSADSTRKNSVDRNAPKSADASKNTQVKKASSGVYDTDLSGFDIQVSEKQLDVLYEKLDEKNIELKKSKNLNIFLGSISIVLGVCVIAMFFITSTIGSPTILNYEQEIINKYASWEQQLIEKEKSLIELQQKLGQ